MLTRDDFKFTSTEAAVLSGLSVKAVNNAIDKKTIPAIAGMRAGQATRLVDFPALMSLALERRMGDRFAPELRRDVFAAAANAVGNTVTLYGGFLTFDLREPRRELAKSLRALRRARRLVVSDPEIMGGDPVFRGTRVPVHAIADLCAQGEAAEDILHSYPRLTAEMVEAAPLYAAAYPLRGRPRKQPWHDHPPVHAARRKLASNAAG